MKKTLLATSLFCAFSAITCAQSSVTLYGVIDGGLSYTHRGGNSDTYSPTATNSLGLAYGMQSGNRFGLKGVEDLGNGNKLTFQLENGFDLGNGTTEQSARLFGRQAWFGVENDSWGYGRAGRQYNFATDYFGAIDPFSLGFGQAGMGSAFGTTNMYTMSNSIKYQTPNMNGFQAGLGYSFSVGEASVYYGKDNPSSVATGSSAYNYDSTNNNRQITLGARYASGPLYLAASYDQVYGANTPANNSGVDPYNWNIGASYDFNVTKIAVAYGQTRNGAIRGAGDGMTGALSPYWEAGNGVIRFDTRQKTDSFLVGLTVPVNSASRVFASWTYVLENDSTNTALALANQSAYNIGYSYDFTKRTNMYAFFSYMNNVNGLELTKSMVGVGMRHQF